VASDWRVPSELPDLRRVGIIALDTETNDEGLRADRGSAWPWRGGHICGVSVAYHADGNIRSYYFPIRHPDTENFDPERLHRWVRDHVNSGVRFITQNGLYDWGWLRTEAGITMPPAERLEEIGALATIIDENRFSYKLDDLCDWRGLPGKDVALLEQAVKAAGFKVNKKNPLQSHIWRLPARYVGPYAEADAANTLALFESLNPVLDTEGTRDAYRLEVDLLPMVHEMRRRGIRVDQSAAEQGRDYCLQKRDQALAELSQQLGSHVSMAEIASRKWLVRTFDAHNISYPRTAKGNPSFKAGKLGWMATHSHWLPQLIATANKYNHAGSTFLEGHILRHLVGGRVYAEINPFRSEEGGTKSFRFSYADPPLQQMPSHDEELGPLIRHVFLPEEGELWCTVDCSQQEFRFVVHYAHQHGRRKSAEAVGRYRADADADFHALVATITGLDRTAAKAVNFAKIYGAGPAKFAQMIGKPPAQAQQIYDQYDRELPFLRELSKIYTSRARQQGFITLYDGTRRHFDKWAPDGAWKKGAGPCDIVEAQRRLNDPDHPWYQRRPLYRAGTHTALNALIQGSAARHTKIWMRAVWRAGIVPRLQMHDGLELSVATREQGELVARLACEAVKLEVPMRADIKYGRSWGDAKHTWEQLHGVAPAIVAAGDEPIQSQDGCLGDSGSRGGSQGDAESVSDDVVSEVHICVHCHLDPPDRSERPSAYNDEWLHPRCEQAFTHARMAEEGLLGDAPSAEDNGGRANNGSNEDDDARASFFEEDWPDEEPRAGYRTAEPPTGKPYASTYARLLQRGYRRVSQFNYALPGGRVLYCEDRFELQGGIQPSDERPAKTCRFWHSVNGTAYNNTGPRDERIIYGWQAVIDAGPGATVHVTEGARKAQALLAKGGARHRGCLSQLE
jgi:DNA polymerase I-like protein with 3'-5' exonuclease and polymerase domains